MLEYKLSIANVIMNKLRQKVVLTIMSQVDNELIDKIMEWMNYDPMAQ